MPIGDDLRGEFLEQVAAPCDHAHARTFRCEPSRNGVADPHAGAGDQRRFVAQLEVHGFLLDA
jgi:hypothetical protein